MYVYLILMINYFSMIFLTNDRRFFLLQRRRRSLESNIVYMRKKEKEIGHDILE